MQDTRRDPRPLGRSRYVTKTWYLPVGRFDNREDLTTFVREDRASWKQDDIDKVHAGLKQAFDALATANADR